MAVKIKHPKENLADLLKGKKVLFLENDNGLYHGLDQLEEFIIANKIKYKVLFEVDEIPMENIIKEIKKCDVLIFQTQWVYKVSQEISKYMFASKDKKIVIECYLSDPTWYYKPKAVHDVYICRPPIRYSKTDPVMEGEWKFYKLSQKPYWDYKNKFDK